MVVKVSALLTAEVRARSPLHRAKTLLSPDLTISNAGLDEVAVSTKDKGRVVPRRVTIDGGGREWGMGGGGRGHTVPVVLLANAVVAIQAAAVVAHAPGSHEVGVAMAGMSTKARPDRN